MACGGSVYRRDNVSQSYPSAIDATENILVHKRLRFTPLISVQQLTSVTTLLSCTEAGFLHPAARAEVQHLSTAHLHQQSIGVVGSGSPACV